MQLPHWANSRQTHERRFPSCPVCFNTLTSRFVTPPPMHFGGYLLIDFPPKQQLLCRTPHRPEAVVFAQLLLNNGGSQNSYRTEYASEVTPKTVDKQIRVNSCSSVVLLFGA